MGKAMDTKALSAEVVLTVVLKLKQICIIICKISNVLTYMYA